MQLTLLQLVQDQLAAIDAQNVTDVNETEEASMCVNIANRAFEEMVSGFRWKHFKQLSQLNAGANLNELVLPTGTFAIDPHNIYYDGELVFYVEPERFLQFTISRNTSDSNVDSINNIKVFNDRDPVYYTTYDDETLVFDAIPDSVSGLDATDSLAMIWVAPTARLSQNADIFDLPAQAFPALNALSISKALGELKGDTQEAARIYRTYLKERANLARNARVIDVLTDVRKHIVPRWGTIILNPKVFDA